LYSRVTVFYYNSKKFVNEELWDRDLATLHCLRRLFFSFCRICVISVRGIVANGCSLQASALTYISLMSMVPVLALMISVSKGFGAQQKLLEIIGLQYSDKLEQFVVIAGSKISELPTGIITFIKTIFETVERAKFSAIGALGLLGLLWAVMKAMSRVEIAFNNIWGVKESRTYFRKFGDFTSVLVVVPLLILAATSVNTILSSDAVLAYLHNLPGGLTWFYLRILKLTGVVSIVIAFSTLYMFMPNTKVKIFSALSGGLVAGILWYLLQRFYIVGQVGITKYNTVYGTFAAIPFFLVWIHTSWLLVLVGAEVSFAVQNNRTYTMEGRDGKSSVATMELLGLIAVFEACKSFYAGDEVWSAVRFQRKKKIPSRLFSSIIAVLVAEHLLLPVKDEEQCFVPARDMDAISVADVESAFRGKTDVASQQLAMQGEYFEASRHFTNSYELFMNKLSEKTFAELVKNRES